MTNLRLTKLSERLSELINEGIALHKLFPIDIDESLFWGPGENYLNFIKWRESCLNIIRVISGNKSSFYISFPKVLEAHNNYQICKQIVEGLGIIKSLKEELERGLITEIETLISADLLTSIYEQSEVLLKAGYKDAVGVYCRIILETSLKKLCDINVIRYPKKATINSLADLLRKKGLLNLVEWRQVQAWADIGNAAAHGRFDEYNEEQVKTMMQGINEFIKRKLV